MTTTNPMYALHNRIESALLATYGPIERWDTDFGVGLSSWQYKSLAATMAEWFMDWIKDERMVRTPGTVEIRRDELDDTLYCLESFRAWGLYLYQRNCCESTYERFAALAKEDPA